MSQALEHKRYLRTFLTAVTVEALGLGMYGAISVIYFTRTIGFSATVVGLALTCAGVFGLVVSVPLGAISDKLDARRVLVAALVVQSIATLALTWVASIPAFFACTAVIVLGDRTAYGARGAIMAKIFAPDERVRVRASVRVGMNVAMAAGTVVSGVALQLDSGLAYRAVIAATAATFAISALVSIRLPSPLRELAARDSRLVVFRDVRYLTITALNGLLSLHVGILEVALPLWLVGQTTLPRWSVTVALLLNMAIVVLLQVRLSGGTEAALDAAKVERQSSLLLLGSCCLFALTIADTAWLSWAFLAIGMTVYTLGEIRQSAAGWGLSYALAPEDRQGQYQAAFGVGVSGAMLFAPAVVTLIVIGHPTFGWYALGIVLYTFGLAFPPLVGRLGVHKPQ